MLRPVKHPAALCNRTANVVLFVKGSEIAYSLVRHVCVTQDEQGKTIRTQGPLNKNYPIEDEGNNVPELYPPGNTILAKYCQSRSPSFQRLNPPCEQFIRFYLRVGYGA